MNTIYYFTVIGLFILLKDCGPSMALSCHQCEHGLSHPECNKGLVELCTSEQTACWTGVIQDGNHSVLQMSKGCVLHNECPSVDLSCTPDGSGGSVCHYCCFQNMCNSRDWPPPQNPCMRDPCRNGARCEVRDGTFYCHCSQGYSGRHCQDNVKNTSPCKHNPCFNNGLCLRMDTFYKCDCPPSWTGIQCEIGLDPCSNTPCLNGATCFQEEDHFTCKCKHGFSGPLCENEYSPCRRNQCLNGGICTPHTSGYTCLCRPGFTGTNCQTKMESCFICEEERGLFMDRYNCSNFYQCEGWVPFRKSCPKGLHFSLRVNRCDLPWKAKCIPDVHRETMTGQKYHSEESNCDDGDNPSCDGLLPEEWTEANALALEELSLLIEDTIQEIFEDVLTDTVIDVLDELEVTTESPLPNRTTATQSNQTQTI